MFYRLVQNFYAVARTSQERTREKLHFFKKGGRKCFLKVPIILKWKMVRLRELK